MIFPIGPSVNALAIMGGSLLGIALGSKLPDKMRKTVLQCLGLSAAVIGIQMALQTEAPVLMIFSLLIGSIIGEAIDIETRFLNFGNTIRKRIKSKNPKFTEGYVTASVLFCVGAMSIIGSFDEGLRNDTTIVFSKSVLDCFTSIALASIYGIGVLLSGISVFIYQGALVLFAGFLQPYISEFLMQELTAVGGVMVIGISLNLLELTQMRMSNLVPALLVVVVLVGIFY